MKNHLILLIIVIFSASVYSQDHPCTIYHSNGSKYSLNITEVHELGMVDSSGKYIAYKIIDSLITDSKTLLEKIQSVHIISFVINNKNYVIVFDKSIYNAEGRESSLSGAHTFISINSIKHNSFFLHLQYSLSFLPELYHRIIISGGSSFSQPNYSSMNFGYGFGAKMNVKEFEMQLWFSSTYSTLYIEGKNNKYNFEDRVVFFVSLLNYFDLNSTGSIQFGAGLNVYFNQFEIAGKKTLLSIQAGINFAL